MIGNSRILRSFYIDGESSADYGLMITGEAVWNAAAYDYEFVQIPGRSGDLVLDNRRFENITVTYPCALHDLGRMADVRSWLMSKRGYHEITDDYNPGEYRLGVVIGGIDVDPFKAKHGTFTVSFNCKPQRFLENAERLRFVPIYSDGSQYLTSDIVLQGTLEAQGETIIIDRGSTASALFPDLVSVRYAFRSDAAYTTITRAQLVPYMSWVDDHAELDLVAAVSGLGAGGQISIVTTSSPDMTVRTRYDATDAWTEKMVTASATITNPTPYTAKPLVEIFAGNAAGSTISPPAVTIGEITVSTTTDFEGALYVDSDIEDAYLIQPDSTKVNANSYTTLEKGGEVTTEFPTLAPGENVISLVSSTTVSGTGRMGVGSLEITPRFYLI